MIRRVELLIAPCDTAPVDPSEAGRCLARSLNSPQLVQRTTKNGQMIICTYEGQCAIAKRSDTEDLSITEGCWPEPVGLRLVVSSDPEQPCWTIDIDRYGLRPLYFGFDRRRRPVVSTRPEMVAALIKSRLSTQALAEQLLVGYTLDNHSIFEDVFRLRPQKRLSYGYRDGLRVVKTCIEAETPGRVRLQPPKSGEQWVKAITHTVTDAFERGYAMELSGGVDSRLVLAIGLHGGATPGMAFTLGEHDDDDVKIAKLICDRCNIQHRIVPVEIDPTSIAVDAYDFAMRSGFATNACSHAWMPAAFEKLSALRTGQIGGGGGECASGFYYGPADFLRGTRALNELWVRARLFKSGIDLKKIFGRIRGRLLAADVTKSALRNLRTRAGTWREVSDAFYLSQRVPNAGGPVLSASACWYDPVQPLLHLPHIEWTRSLLPSQRAHRRTQMRLIHEIHPALGEIRYSNDRRYARSGGAKIKQQIRRLTLAATKIGHRLGNRRVGPDQGADVAAEALVQNESVREAIRGLARSSEPNVRSKYIERMLGAPKRYEYELGVLLSAAWAEQTAKSIASQLQSSTRETPLRCAA